MATTQVSLVQPVSGVGLVTLAVFSHFRLKVSGCILMLRTLPPKRVQGWKGRAQPSVQPIVLLPAMAPSALESSSGGQLWTPALLSTRGSEGLRRLLCTQCGLASHRGARGIPRGVSCPLLAREGSRMKGFQRRPLMRSWS